MPEKPPTTKLYLVMKPGQQHTNMAAYRTEEYTGIRAICATNEEADQFRGPKQAVEVTKSAAQKLAVLLKTPDEGGFMAEKPKEYFVEYGYDMNWNPKTKEFDTFEEARDFVKSQKNHAVLKRREDIKYDEITDHWYWQDNTLICNNT